MSVIIISCLQYLYNNAGTLQVHKSLLFGDSSRLVFMSSFTHSYSKKQRDLLEISAFQKAWVTSQHRTVIGGKVRASFWTKISEVQEKKDCTF